MYDFDGVLTDNRVWIDQNGIESVACNRSDGWWINEIRILGIKQVILSTESNPVVGVRAAKLELPCLQGQKNKREGLEKLLQTYLVTADRTCYVGNDINDLECLKMVGFPFAPNDAHPKILALAHYVIAERGGYGIVRHLYDWIQENNYTLKLLLRDE